MRGEMPSDRLTRRPTFNSDSRSVMYALDVADNIGRDTVKRASLPESR